MNNRILWIDNAKGIGMLLVIIAHVINQYNSSHIGSLLIYSFHMPLFFILSGYTISEKTINLDLKSIVLKYLRSLMIPYFVYTFLNMLIWFISSGDYSFDQIKSTAYHLLFLHGWKATWFLSALFFAQIECVFLMKKFKNTALLFAAAIVVSIVLTYVAPHLHTAIKAILLGTIATPFVLFGALMKLDKVDRIVKSKITMCLCFIAIPIFTFLNGKIDFVWYVFGKSSVVWLIAGITGSVFVIAVSRMIHLNVLQAIGKNSLTIMCIHQTIRFALYHVLSMVISNPLIQSATLLVSTLLLTFLACPLVTNLYNRVFKRHSCKPTVLEL